jgi:hypothetical protein
MSGASETLAQRIERIMRECGYKPNEKKMGELLDRFEQLIPGECEIERVSVGGHVRGAVERVEAYGLEIEIDGHGRATDVIFPDGATWER